MNRSGDSGMSGRRANRWLPSFGRPHREPDGIAVGHGQGGDEVVADLLVPGGPLGEPTVGPGEPRGHGAVLDCHTQPSTAPGAGGNAATSRWERSITTPPSRRGAVIWLGACDTLLATMTTTCGR